MREERYREGEKGRPARDRLARRLAQEVRSNVTDLMTMDISGAWATGFLFVVFLEMILVVAAGILRFQGNPDDEVTRFLLEATSYCFEALRCIITLGFVHLYSDYTFSLRFAFDISSVLIQLVAVHAVSVISFSQTAAKIGNSEQFFMAMMIMAHVGELLNVTWIENSSLKIKTVSQISAFSCFARVLASFAVTFPNVLMEARSGKEREFTLALTSLAATIGYRLMLFNFFIYKGGSPECRWTKVQHHTVHEAAGEHALSHDERVGAQDDGGGPRRRYERDEPAPRVYGRRSRTPSPVRGSGRRDDRL